MGLASSAGERAVGLVDRTGTLQGEANEELQADFPKRSQKAFSAMVMVIDLSQSYLINSCKGSRSSMDSFIEHDTHEQVKMLKKQCFHIRKFS